MQSPRAYVTIVLAMSADGKIADSVRSPARFSSSQDLVHLETEIARADAALFGAGTLKAYGTCLPVRQPALIAQRQAQQKSSQPIQIVCSGSGQLDPTLSFFQQPVPRWLLTTEAGATLWTHTSVFERILGLLANPTDWTAILQIFFSMGIQRLVVLGGGTLTSHLIQQKLIDELHLTICPLLLGGKTAPTPFDGLGLKADLALHLKLVETKVIGNEVFLNYRCCHLARD
ncbi:MAG: RibD family protein [Leptolyngbya sp. SIO1D8]|nr:RibD family protein [Leptolyngbya sp. SIO1D8]